MSITRWSLSRALRSHWRASLALLACIGAISLRVPRTADLTAEFPQHSPTAIAHFLADFTNHPKLYSHITGAWWIEEERRNLTSWHYSVRYECGAWCSGRVALSAHDERNAHRVLVRDTRCYALPLLPWPQYCEEMETDTVLSARGGGALLRERAVRRCGALSLACDARRALAGARTEHLRALRHALANY